MSNKFIDRLLEEKTYVVGIFDDDDVMMDALQALKDKNYVAKDAYLPFPVHGIDKMLNMRSSRIGYAAFAFGALGAGFALWLQIYTMTDWGLNFGGKPVVAIPSFIPITFELTVLISALGLAGVYFARSHLAPGLEPRLFDKRQTSDRFVVIYEVESGKQEEVKQYLDDNKAVESRIETVTESKLGVPLPLKY